LTDVKEEELQTNSQESTAFYLQSAYDFANEQSLQAGRDEVTSNPATYNLFTVAQYLAVVNERDSRPTKQAYDAVVAQRDARPTKEAYDTAIAERDARPTLEEVKDGRLGSVLLLPDAAENKVKIRFSIEESDELGAWTSRTEEAEVDIPLAAGKRFFRFSVKEDE